MPFTTGGIKAEMEKFDKLTKGISAAARDAVKAGGKVLAKRLADAAPVRTGALAKSIKAGDVEFDWGDGYSCEVGPKGKHPDTGEPLAKIGNILEYGRSNMPARPWFNPCVKQAEPDVIAAMRKEIDKHLGGG